MNFFKDAKHATNDPSTGYRPSLSLIGATASIANDYVKRPYVFRLKLGSGGDYLFQCKDQVHLLLLFFHKLDCSNLYS